MQTSSRCEHSTGGGGGWWVAGSGRRVEAPHVALPPPVSVWRAWPRRCVRPRRPPASRAPWLAAAPPSSSSAGASRSSSASTWMRARAAGPWRDPHRPISREPQSSWSPAACSAPLGAALTPMARSRTPALSLLKLHVSPGRCCITPPRDPVSSGDPSLGGLGCSCHKPLSRPHVTSCPSLLPQAPVTS